MLEMKLCEWEEAVYWNYISISISISIQKTAFTHAIELDHTFTVAHLQLGVCHFLTGNYRSAESEFVATIEVNFN
jgi:hypothetical protein